MKYDSLAFLQKQIDIDSPVAELANQEYEAFIFTSDGRTYQSRKAKKTPLKKGYFQFPKSVLIKHHILTNNDIVGKMAFRVYPTWEYDLNKTALKTQSWQSHYFTDLSDN